MSFERKAGDRASDPKLFQAIWKHLRSDGIEDQPANQMAAEMMTHGDDFESSVAQYQDNLARFKDKGYNKHAAQAMAVESLEEGAEQPRNTTRFAGTYG